jgi:hypothetical protein
MAYDDGKDVKDKMQIYSCERERGEGAERKVVNN